MPAGILRVTPEKLQSTASSFEQSASNVQNLTQQMTSIVTSLSGQVWSGEAATAYVNKFKGLQDIGPQRLIQSNERPAAWSRGG